MCALRRTLLFVGTTALVANCQGEDHDDDSGIEEDALSGDQMRRLHKNFDADGDGKVSLHEIMAFSARMRMEIASKDIGTVLDEIDVNKDGSLSWDELVQDMKQWSETGGEEQGLEQRVESERLKFQAADADGNGVLSRQELPALFYPETHDGVLELTADASLKEKDANGDGKLSPKEFWEGSSVEGEDPAISEEEHADFGKLDKSGDGLLDLQELKAWESGKFHTEEAMKQLFEIADKNGDLYLTPDELDAAREAAAGSDAQYHLMEWAEHQEL